MNVVATRFIKPVLGTAQSTLALGSILVRLFANFRDFDIPVVVTVVVVVDLLAGDAVVGDHRLLLKGQRGSVVEGLVDTGLGLTGAAIIVESGKVDVESVGTDRSNKVLLVHVDAVSVSVAVSVPVSVVATVTIGTVQF